MAKLEEYKRKRQFDRTPEPSGEADEPQKNRRLPNPKLGLEVRPASEYGDMFVVQKHAATRLHYDFRLAIDGTLKSWAVPKGPSQNSADKRLAVQTEDHPLEYGGFEGKIPEGNYGAGTVMVWDRGTFLPEGRESALKQLERGEIKFNLNGEKLKGSFVLVKLKRSAKGNEWLMIKHKDATEDPGWDIEEHDGSVLTGRTLQEIKEEQPPRRAATPLQAGELEGAKKSTMPARMEPMLATIGERAFSSPEWLFEIKWDGVRALSWIDNGALTMRARHGADITGRYPELEGMPQAFTAKQALVDGEIVALNERGLSDFGRLQERMHVRAPAKELIERVPAVYYIFDLLYCDGYDLRGAALLERKQLLQRLLHSSEKFRYADHQLEKGKELFALAGQTGLEGIVAKRINSRYSSGRSPNWVKLKVTQTVDAVIGGWTAARTNAIPLGSLLLGLYEGKKLRFVGHVGTGFDGKKLQELAARMNELKSSTCPFDVIPETNEKPFWVKPSLVARVRFTAWTQEDVLRHPVFVALREDAKPEESRWEDEKPTGAALTETSDGVARTEAAPSVVHSPEVIGRVLKTKAQIENELFKGREATINIELDGKRLRFTNLNKVYFPESGYTKRNLIAYYYRVADYILPFLRDRALVLRRYPDGIKGQAFFQKNMPEGLPDWFVTTPIESETRGEPLQAPTANDRASLLYLTGLGCIDENPWSNRIGDLEHPDYFFFDLDPSDGTEFSVVVTIAKALLEELTELQLTSFLKTSGATGIHIFLPVEPVYTYEQLRTFGEIVARTVTAKHPGLVTNERSVAKRPAGRVLIDVQQNAHGRPLASAYSVRAFPKAPVSTPILPRELRATLRPETLNMETILDRLKEKGDLWADFWKKRQRLEDAIELLSSRIPQKRGSR
jgi:bifunctional non-homologous end joining protein LigD